MQRRRTSSGHRLIIQFPWKRNAQRKEIIPSPILLRPHRLERKRKSNPCQLLALSLRNCPNHARGVTSRGRGLLGPKVAPSQRREAVAPPNPPHPQILDLVLDPDLDRALGRALGRTRLRLRARHRLKSRLQAVAERATNTASYSDTPSLARMARWLSGECRLGSHPDHGIIQMEVSHAR